MSIPRPSLEDILKQVETAERIVKETKFEKDRLAEQVLRNEKQDTLNLQKIKFLSQELEEKRNRIKQLHGVIGTGFDVKSNQMSLIDGRLDREDAVQMIQEKIHSDNMRMRNDCLGFQNAIGESLKRGKMIFRRFSGLLENQTRWMGHLLSTNQSLMKENEIVNKRNNDLQAMLDDKNKQLIEDVTQRKKREKEMNEVVYQMKRDFEERLLNVTSKVNSGSNLQVEYYRKKLVQKQMELDDLLGKK